MLDFAIKQGDLEPKLRVTLLDENGVPIPLAAANDVKFSMIDPGSETAKISLAGANIIDSPNGVVEYPWSGTDTDTPGDYNGEFKVNWSAGGSTRFPNHRYLQIKVLRAIA